MRRLLMLVWFLAGTVPTVSGGLLELKSMIKKVTGKSALTSYGFYGCYCGWGGRGTPKDGTDWCCWGHDQCYGQLEESGCRTRTQSYKYRLSWGQVTCGKAGASHSGTERGSTSAVPRELGAFCQVQLCACDRNLVYCLKRNLQSYNPLYQYFPNFFCT